jgi:prepilin-type N-terminal cleavage/methylation domain-containing protein
VSRKAFTLPELLVVLAIVVILASVLFPVFVSAREAARKTACFSNYKQVNLATGLYLNDYDDYYMPTNYDPSEGSSSLTDRTWVQVVMPYVTNYSIFKCPSDHTDRPRREATFDDDLVPGDTYSQYYTASLRTNIGYNYLYFSPIIDDEGRWTARPRSTAEIADQDQTILFVDSTWIKSNGNDVPSGGGSYVVVPPCRYVEDSSGNKLDTFNNYQPSSYSPMVFTAGTNGWEVGQQPSPLRWGGVWPWHNGLVTAMTPSGGVKLYSPDKLAVGCNPQPNWNGLISDQAQYLWDTQ